jgi:hypothetical protein
MLIALEQAKIVEQQLANSSVEQSAELQKQLEIVRENVKFMEEQIEIYKGLLVTAKTMQEMKDKVCAEEIDKATPSFWDNLQKYLAGVGIGGILVGVITLL